MAVAPRTDERQPEPPTEPVAAPWVLLLIADPALPQSAREVWEGAGFGVEVALNDHNATHLLPVMTPTLIVIEDAVYQPRRR